MRLKLIKQARTVFDRFAHFLVIVSCLAAVFIELAVLIEIVTRRFLRVPQIWIQDSIGFCLFGITYLTAAWLLKTEQHVRLDLVSDRLSASSRYLLAFITSLVGAGICLVVTLYSGQVVADHLRRHVLASTEVTILKAPLLAIITLAMLMLMVQFLRRAYNFWTKWKLAKSEVKPSLS